MNPSRRRVPRGTASASSQPCRAPRETAARVGGNLGYQVTFALDGTFTFDLAGPDGTELTADQLSQTTATNLHGGGFATITSTEEILGG
jgi:hypothetical protein